jgi:hypothetical protein
MAQEDLAGFVHSAMERTIAPLEVVTPNDAGIELDELNRLAGADIGQKGPIADDVDIESEKIIPDDAGSGAEESNPLVGANIGQKEPIADDTNIESEKLIANDDDDNGAEESNLLADADTGQKETIADDTNSESEELIANDADDNGVEESNPLAGADTGLKTVDSRLIFEPLKKKSGASDQQEASKTHRKGHYERAFSALKSAVSSSHLDERKKFYTDLSDSDFDFSDEIAFIFMRVGFLFLPSLNLLVSILVLSVFVE